MFKMMLLLKDAVKKRIIRSTDFYFAQCISENNPIIMLVAACMSYECHHGYYFLHLKNFEKNIFFSQNSNNNFIKKIINCLGTISNWSLELIKSSAIGDGSKITPLVLYKKKIYLYKMWKAEDNILTFLYKKRRTKKVNIEKCYNILNNLFPNENNNMQKIAVALSLIRNIIFILGAPGTGKTTTIIKIIIALIKNSKKTIKIKLSAPTGKAANRLRDILNHSIFNDRLNTIEKKSLPSTAITLHRLLNIQEISQKKMFNKKNPLKLDVLIIDEASMIDILMMENIFSAIEKNTKIIFIGDCNQLPPIEAGFFLRDISEYAHHGYSPDVLLILKEITQCSILKNNKNKKNIFISNNICLLKENYRFKKNSGIHILSNAIYQNNNQIIKKLFNNSIENISYFEMYNSMQYKNMINQIVDKYRYYWKIVYSKEKIKNLIEIFQNYQVLCLLRDGLFGVTGLNKSLEYCMNQKKIIHYIQNNQKKWYVGKPIMITKNDNVLGLYNGNIGITNISNTGNIQVSFLEKNNLIKHIPANILKDYETAWAVTIHKAQGSEFNNTILILPNMDSKVCSKEILYTATTRSKKTLSIYAKKEIFVNSILKKDKILF